MIEMKVRGFSRESTLKLSSATVGEIRNIQSKIILQAFVVPKRRLVAIEKFNNDIEAIVKQPRQLSSENQSLTNIAATYLMYQSEQDKAALLNQVAYPGLHPTVVVSEVSSLDPIYPQKYVWVLIYSVVGLLLGIVVLWIINSLNT